jgi:hypothetical protein
VTVCVLEEHLVWTGLGAVALRVTALVVPGGLLVIRELIELSA